MRSFSYFSSGHRLTQMFALALLLFPCLLVAQYRPTIQTGRPGQSIGALALGAKVFQLQSGYNYNRRDANDFRQNSTTHNTVIRAGILERLEGSILLDWNTSNQSASNGDFQSGGLSNMHIGGRYHILDNEGWIPSIGLQARATLPIQSEPYRTDHVGSAWILATSNDLGNGFGLTTNWTARWSGDGEDAQYGYIINLSYAVNKRIGVFGEAYGPLNDFDTYFDAGVSYLVTPDFMVDFSSGWQGQNGINDWFVDAGFSWRISFRE